MTAVEVAPNCSEVAPSFSEVPQTSQKLPGVLRSSGYLLCYSGYFSKVHADELCHIADPRTTRHLLGAVWEGGMVNDHVAQAKVRCHLHLLAGVDLNSVFLFFVLFFVLFCVRWPWGWFGWTWRWLSK